MLSVCLTFIYCIFVCFLLGVGIRKIVDASFSTVLFTGVIIATVYSQFFSIFAGVGHVANVLLFISCLILIVVFKKEILIYVKKIRNTSGVRIAAIITLLIFWGYISSRGYIHYDSDLYHGQSIRWLEEYGAVFGLGNLHTRLAYNSSLFAVSALFSMKFVCGQSLHIVNGFLAFILSINIIPLFNNIRAKNIQVSDFIRMGLFYYLVSILDEVTSPASDYALMLSVFFITLKWVELLERKEKDEKPYALLCVAGVFAVSIKLTAVFLLLLTIKPVVIMIKEKKTKRIWIYLAIGIFVILPWIIRNVILSGYLIYPFPAIDLFDVDWKIPKPEALYDANEIKAWGTSIAYTAMEKLLILSDFAAIVIGVFYFVINAIKKKINWDNVLIMTVMSCSFLFWYTNSPLARYGYAYILLLPFMIAGILYQRLAVKRYMMTIMMVIAYLFVLWKSISTVKNVVYGWAEEYWVMQKDYGSYEVETYKIGDTVFYKPKSGDQIGYDYFPASVFEKELELRGDSLKDGFRDVGEY